MCFSREQSNEMSFASEGMYTSRERFIKRGFRGEAPRRGGDGSPGKETGMRLLRRFTPRNDKRWAGLQSGGRLPPLPFVVN